MYSKRLKVISAVLFALLFSCQRTTFKTEDGQISASPKLQDRYDSRRTRNPAPFDAGAPQRDDEDVSSTASQTYTDSAWGFSFTVPAGMTVEPDRYIPDRYWVHAPSEGFSCLYYFITSMVVAHVGPLEFEFARGWCEPGDTLRAFAVAGSITSLNHPGSAYRRPTWGLIDSIHEIVTEGGFRALRIDKRVAMGSPSETTKVFPDYYVQLSTTQNPAILTLSMNWPDAEKSHEVIADSMIVTMRARKP